MAYSEAGKRKFLAALIVLAVTAMVLLYFANLLYIQFLIVIWSVVITLALVVYDRDAHRRSSSPGGEAAKKSQLTAAMEELDGRISKAEREDVKKMLRKRKDMVQHELRKLEWTTREQSMAESQMPPADGGLTPLPREPGWWERRRASRQEASHLRRCLDEAGEVLAIEEGEAAREGLKSLANDLRAHSNMMKSARPQSRELDDYLMVWGVLTDISRGAEPNVDYGRYASRWSRSRMKELLQKARTKGLLQELERPTYR